ncbi:hypothetical protein ACFQL1_14960 [Halomicroarcula sp. GCM10025709]|uniref:hypothetical protein n=1 Tax=Haloarcula TaxID=2237 RepID=UPI0024C28131|nr:hypothetical protein [Halomicroarcula sp. YJ-61-S]
MNPETVADARGFVYEPARGPKRRVLYEPRSDGRFERIESVWTGCTWRPTGREIVENVYRI